MKVSQLKYGFSRVLCKGRERADCTVCAVQHALNLFYQDAHQLLASLGRKAGRGIQFRTVAMDLGLRCRPELSGKALVSILDDLHEGRYIVRIAGHVFAVVGGRIIDTRLTNPNCRVKMVYEVPVDDEVFLEGFPELAKAVRLESVDQRVWVANAVASNWWEEAL